jgi:hypothetical protein
MKLLPCPSCERHIRSDETACPFCHQSVLFCSGGRCAESSERTLSRAAVLFLGAAAVASCREPERAAVPPYAAAPVNPLLVEQAKPVEEPPVDAGSAKR